MLKIILERRHLNLKGRGKVKLGSTKDTSSFCFLHLKYLDRPKHEFLILKKKNKMFVLLNL